MTDANIPDELMGRVRKGSFVAFVAFLGISALMAIVTVLFGEFGDFEIRVLGTTSIIAVASICCLCCSAFSAGRSNPLPGAVGIALALLAAGLLIVALWWRISSDGYLRGSAVVSIAAIATAHALALLVVRVSSNHHWVQIATVSAIYGLAALLSSMILFELDAEALFKSLAILAILVALGTLVVPILGRLAHSGARPASLVLHPEADGLYRDATGNRYRVVPVQQSDARTHVPSQNEE